LNATFIKKIQLDPVQITQPHEIEFNPEKTHYFVTCEGTRDVRILDESNDSVIAKIQTGLKPQELTFSTNDNYPYLFVSCMEDDQFAPLIGSVSVINLNDMVLEKSIYTGFQPHGLAADNQNNVVYVANRNANPTGPAPHHQTDCAGRNGNITIIDMKTLELIQGYKAEISVDPYFVDVRN